MFKQECRKHRHEGLPNVSDDKSITIDLSETKVELIDFESERQKQLAVDSVRYVLSTRFSCGDEAFIKEAKSEFTASLRKISEEFKSIKGDDYDAAACWLPVLQNIVNISKSKIYEKSEFLANTKGFMRNYHDRPLATLTLGADNIENEFLVRKTPTFVKKLFPDGNANLTLYRSEFERIVIPDMIDGHKITKLSTDCIQCPNMKELVIPDSVVSIQPDFVPYLSMMLKEHEVTIHAPKTIISKIYRAAEII